MLTAFVLFVACLGSTWAQTGGDKIGFVNLEGIMSLMPETEMMTRSMQAYQKKLSESLQIKENYMRQKLQEYQAAQGSGADAARLKPLEEELQKLDVEIKQAASEAEERLQRRRAEKMQPLLEKLQVEIEKVAKAKGLTYVLNSTDGTATSIVLNAPDGKDITRDVLDAMGIEYPKN